MRYRVRYVKDGRVTSEIIDAASGRHVAAAMLGRGVYLFTVKPMRVSQRARIANAMARRDMIAMDETGMGATPMPRRRIRP